MLRLYFEKEFLDDFYIVFDSKKATRAQDILYTILTKYTETTWYINVEINSMEQLESLKQSNPLIAYKVARDTMPPISVQSIEEHYFEDNLDGPFLIFTKAKRDWFEKAKEKGALCFTFEDYESKIIEITEQYHFYLDPGDESFEWNRIDVFPNASWIVLNDNYIFTDIKHQKIKENLIPLLKQLLNNQKETRVEIWTREFKAKSKEKKISEAEKRKRTLNSHFAKVNVKFKIINNHLMHDSYKFHDRWIYSNYQVIYSGPGFNLMPVNKANNGLFYSKTIFDKDGYYVYKRGLKMHKKYYKELITIKDRFKDFIFT